MMEAQSLTSDQYFVKSHIQAHVEVLHLLQREEDRGATVLNDVDNCEHRRLRRESNFQGLMNRRRL